MSCPDTGDEPGEPPSFTTAIIGRVDRAVGWRKFRGLSAPTDRELAAAAGLTPQQFSDLRKNVRRIQIPEVAALARYLGVRAAWLAFNEEPMESGESPDAAVKKPPPDLPPFPPAYRGSPAEDVVKEKHRQIENRESYKGKKKGAKGR